MTPFAKSGMTAEQYILSMRIVNITNILKDGIDESTARTTVANLLKGGLIYELEMGLWGVVR